MTIGRFQAVVAVVDKETIFVTDGNKVIHRVDLSLDLWPPLVKRWVCALLRSLSLLGILPAVMTEKERCHQTLRGVALVGLNYTHIK